MLDKNNLTPLMRQYYEIKEKHPETLLLFQVGDFYELFFDDAQRASAFLNIALTQRGTTPDGAPIPLCGVPIHVIDAYIAKLIKGGFKVAICDQIQVNKQGKVIERQVTQVLTPGTLTDSALLDEKSASYLTICFPAVHECALISVEMLTGQLFMTILEPQESALEAELSRFFPDEILLPDTKLGRNYQERLLKMGYAVTCEPFIQSDELTSQVMSWTTEHAQSLLATISRCPTGLFALILLYTFFTRNNQRGLEQLTYFKLYSSADFLLLDASTNKNLELTKNAQDGSKESTLLQVLDRAETAMGSRMIKKWLLRPLVDLVKIEERLDVVQLFLDNALVHDELASSLKKMGDLERIVGRIALSRAQLHDYQKLMASLAVVPDIARFIFDHQKHALLSSLLFSSSECSRLMQFLQNSINDDISQGWLIKSGYNRELDALRAVAEQGTQAIVALERKEQLANGISSLKIRYSGAHGYGIEITKPNLPLVPDHYVRIQTLVNRERFTTQELKDLEYESMRSRTQLEAIEKEIFEQLKKTVEEYIPTLKKLSHCVATLDALQSLACIAREREYTRPRFNDEKKIAIVDGRHPVMECKLGTRFIANSTLLDQDQSLWIITGPNMGGKSTYLRQVALISIMAQMGSFVPAKECDVPLLDRIFTRIGAADNVAQGKSTFLVEMEETALICSQATERSLVILDEVGRGTSTFDGLAIAQAVVEYIYTVVKAKCLFATHYHELTQLASQFSGIGCYYAASMRTADGIVLLHTIKQGVADGSFGLDVAKLAQLPDAVIRRAHEILISLERVEPAKLPEASTQAAPKNDRLEEQEKYNQMAQELRSLDCDRLSAREALQLLYRYKEALR